MKRFCLVSVLIIALAANILWAAKIIPVREFFRNPEKAAFQVSPGGEFIAFVQPYSNRLNVFVQKLGSTEAIRITSETARDISGFFWKSDNRIVYLKDFKGDENFHVVAVDRDGQNLKDLTPFEKVRAQIIDSLEDNEKEMLIGLNKRNPQVFDAYRLNVESGEMKMAAENPGNIVEWVTDHDGKIRAATTSDGVNTTLLYRDSEDAPFKPVITTNFREPSLPCFSPSIISLSMPLPISVEIKAPSSNTTSPMPKSWR